MGTNVSKQITDQTQTILKNTLNQQNNNTDNKINCNSNSSQKMNLGSVNASGCTVNVAQNLNVKLDCTLKASQQVKSGQGATATAKLQALATQKLQQSNAKLNLFQTNLAVATQKSNQYLKDNVENIINSNIKSTIATNASNSQELDLKSIQCSGGGTINVSQDGIINSIATSSTQQIIKGWQKATGIDMSTMDDSQSVIQKNIGISLAIFGGILIFLLVIYFAVKFMGGKNVSNKYVQQRLVPQLQAPNYRAPIPISNN